MRKLVQSQKYILETKVASIYSTAFLQVSHTAYLQHASELPNWDKSNKIFKQIILVTSNAEEKIQKLCFYFFCNFDENMKGHIRTAIKIHLSCLSSFEFIF